MKKRLVIGVIVAVAAVAAVLVLVFRNGEDEGALAVSGNVEVTEVNTGFKISGRVTTLFTDEGRSVKPGEKIAVLDSAEYEAQVAQNRAALRNAEGCATNLSVNH